MNSGISMLCDDVLAQLRRIVRAMDVHSQQLRRKHALTAPQLVLLREVVKHEHIAIGTLARLASLSNATVTGIIDRLEQRGLVERVRNGQDRRQVLVSSTDTGKALAGQAPALFQEQFITALGGLPHWKQAQMLDSLSLLAVMMGGAAAAPAPETESEAALAAGTNGLSPQDGFLASCQMLLDKPSAPDGAPAPEAGRQVALTLVRAGESLPPDVPPEPLAHFLHEHMRPYEDTVEDILGGLDYALSTEAGRGGFVLLAHVGERLAGALVMLDTGMSGYVPGRLLLFVAVDPALRGRGIGAQLVQAAQAQCPEGIKLHVEYHNPARRLYERLGFTSKYAEMRWSNEPGNH